VGETQKSFHTCERIREPGICICNYNFFLIYIRYLNYNLCAGGRKQGRMYDYWFAEGLPTFKCMILVFANYTCIKST